MSGPSFDELRAEMFRLYGKAEYAAAWALVEREAPRFPEQAWSTTYWRICLANRSGDRAATLRILGEGVTSGHWWGEDGLRSDPDLQTLQDDPEFERLVAICRERQSIAQARAKPELLTLTPDPSVRPPVPLIIALHGGGGTAREFARHWQAAASMGWLVALAQSSRVFGPHGYSWRDVDLAGREIFTHFQALTTEHQVHPDRVVLAGFSQGGWAALWLALKQAIPAAGFFGIACAVRDLDAVGTAVNEALARKLRAYLLVGDADYVFERTRALHGLLESAGVSTELEIRPGLGHSIPEDFEPSLRRALTHITRSPH